MNKISLIVGVALATIAGACSSSDNTFEQSNTFSMMSVMTSPDGKSEVGNTSVTTVTDSYNPSNASVSFAGLTLSDGLSVNAKAQNMNFGTNQDGDRVQINSTSKTTSSGFGSLSLSSLNVVVTFNNMSLRGSFADGTALFAVSSALGFYSNAFIRPAGNPEAEAYVTNDYAKNMVSVTFNATKKTANISISNVRFEKDTRENIYLLYENIPFTFNAATGVISLRPTEPVPAYKLSGNVKGDEMPDYSATSFVCTIYGAFDGPSVLQLKTSKYDANLYLYDYGKLPNADTNE